VVSTSYPRASGDPAGHFVQSEVERLVKAGHEVHVFAPGVGAPSPIAELHWLPDRGAFGWPGASARLRERPTRALGATEFVLRAASALRRLGPFSRLQAHFLVPSGWPIATSACTVESETELELIGHGSDVRAFCRLPKHLQKQIAKSWLRRRASVRVTSHELAALIRRKNPELSSVIRVQESPIDLCGVPTRAHARHALGLGDAAKVAVVVARLIPEKRVALALEALTLHPNLLVLVVGDGPELSLLQARFPEAQFLGRRSRAATLTVIAAADVLVSASAREGAPTVVREARALGVSVIAVEAGDLATWAERDPGILLTRAPGC
jgi:teichuronic acid biosynthesis glycosyltransferase TuaC